MKSLEIVSGRDSRKGHGFEEVFGKGGNIKEEHLEIKKRDFFPTLLQFLPHLLLHNIFIDDLLCTKHTEARDDQTNITFHHNPMGEDKGIDMCNATW